MSAAWFAFGGRGFSHGGSTALRARLPAILRDSLVRHRPPTGHQAHDCADAECNDDFDGHSFKEGYHRIYSCT